MKLGELLNTKDIQYRVTVTVRPNDTIADTVRELAEHDMGSLPVCKDNGELVGIITERDIVRKCFTRCNDCAKIKVKDAMSQKVVIGNPDDDLDYAISVMKQEKIRHLPIVESKKVIGMISMRDLLGVSLEETRTEVKYLSDYISGGFV
jgi:CBS domain-containing protein